MPYSVLLQVSTWVCFKTVFKLSILGFIGWFASGLSRVKGSIIYIFMLGVSLFLLLISAFCFLYMANFDDPAISLSKTLDEMVKIEYNTNDNIAKVSQYNLNIIKWGTLTPYCHERNSDQMTILKTQLGCPRSEFSPLIPN